MADIITMASVVKLSGNSSTPALQAIKDAIDVSAYDTLDLQINLLALTGIGGIKVELLTSMQNQNDDGSWITTGSSGTIAGTNLPDWGMIRYPVATTTALLRYVRYQIDFQSSSTVAVVSITGLARRKM